MDIWTRKVCCDRSVVEPFRDDGEKSIPMEFIQVLIHQHAKTLVALQDLEREVLDLKLLKKEPSSCGCWLQKISDSGFTEKSKSNEDDELLSLLSLIQFKVESLNFYDKKEKIELGTLDNILDNFNFDFKKFKFNDKIKIQAILNCNNNIELKRQLLFTTAKLQTMLLENSLLPSAQQSQLLQLPPQQLLLPPPALLPPVEPPVESERSLMRVENEKLRMKLLELEIELEGTNAKLRMLNKSQIPILKNVKVKSPPSAKSLSSIGSTRSLIPIPLNRIKNKNSNKNIGQQHFWAQWFG